MKTIIKICSVVKKIFGGDNKITTVIVIGKNNSIRINEGKGISED